MQAETDGFDTLLRQIRQQAGLDCSCYKDAYLRRRIRAAMDGRRVTSYADFCRYLHDNPSEYTALLDIIGVNVTEFFRDIPVYRLLADTVLPGILKAKRLAGERSVRLWSAPCATGEEPYSLAVILSEMLGRGRGFDVEIAATDIDEEALETARRGVYPGDRLATVGDALKNKYFLPVDGGYAVAEALQRMVRFRRVDLLAGIPSPGHDLIMCRNFLIYVKPEFQSELFAMFHASLVPGGYLVLGKTESLPQGFSDRFETVSCTERVYRRIQHA